FLRLRRLLRQVVDREFRGGTFFGRQVVGRRLRRSRRRHKSPDFVFERRAFRCRSQFEVHAAVTEPVRDALGEAHLGLYRLAVFARLLRSGEHYDLARAVGERGEQRVHPHPGRLDGAGANPPGGRRRGGRGRGQQRARAPPALGERAAALLPPPLGGGGRGGVRAAPPGGASGNPFSPPPRGATPPPPRRTPCT